MKRIGFKNFRKFENFPSIELGDVTYLVGQNNAGKSTMVKAAILVLENLRQKSPVPFGNSAYFSFVSPVHDLHVETFARALHYNSKEKRIHFSASLSDFDFEITVAPATDALMHGYLQKDTDRTAPIEYILVRDNILGVTLEIQPFVNKYVLKISGEADSVDTSNDALIANITNRIASLRSETEIGSDLKKQVEINSELYSLEKRLAMLTKNKNVSNSEQLIFNTLHMTYSPGSEGMFSIVREVDALAYMAKYDDALEKARSASLVFGMSETEKNQQGQYLSKLRKHSEVLSKMATRLTSLLSSVDVMYIPAHLASQDMVMNAHSKDLFAKEVDKYVHQSKKYDMDYYVYRFIQKWMDADHFNIGKGFTVEEKLPGYYTLTIDTYDNGAIPVGDMGMGTNQLMILLLHIANTMQDARITRYRSTNMLSSEEKLIVPLIFIEEPEQNLHPNLQSKLAEFFYELTKSIECPIKLIIETHSEYIIRKSQVIVCKAEYRDQWDLDEHNPIKIYYFPSDMDSYPYDMGFKPSGRFGRSFGHGFFDISGQLSFELPDNEISSETKNINWSSF